MFGYNPCDYDLKVELAKCCNDIATVYLAAHVGRTGRVHVAVKKYRLDKATDEIARIVRDELLAMRQFNHPNLHSFHTAFVHGSEMFFVSPIMCFGSCKDTIRNCFGTGFPEILVALIVRDVLAGLEYMHRRGYIHRSIRASHILLNRTLAVLSGFRECTSMLAHGERVRALHTLTPLNARSLNWLAPEVLEQNIIGYTEKSDIYALGITCCELANGIEPFADAQPTFMLTEKIRGNVPTLLDRTTCPASEEIIEMTANASADDATSADAGGSSAALAAKAQQIYCKRIFSDEFHQFTEICLEKRPANRWSAMQLLSHSFLKQCRHTSILDQLQRFGLQTSDYAQLRDENLALCHDMAMGDLSMRSVGNEWQWDF